MKTLLLEDMTDELPVVNITVLLKPLEVDAWVETPFSMLNTTEFLLVKVSALYQDMGTTTSKL
jgi:hypothetical protein